MQELQDQIAKDKKTKNYLFVLIALLFLGNFFLIYKLINTDKQKVNAQAQVDDLTDERQELRKLLDETEVELENYKHENTSLDSTLNLKNAELELRIGQVRAMLNDKNSDKQQLQKAKAELFSLRSLIATYKGKIDSLNIVNSNLKNENQSLADENNTVKRNLDDQNDLNKTLAKENETLAEKVKIGSRLKATNITIDGIKLKGSREVEKSRLSRIDKIKVKFNIDKNDVANIGVKTIFLKLIAPNGSTVSNNSAGSGTFEINGESALYTSKQNVDFNNTGQEVTIYFDKIPGMGSGSYKGQLYCDEFMMGEGVLKLK